mgnify:CR=1 FL=1
MIEQQYSITRTRATWKPRVAADDLPFVKDSAGNVLVALNGDAEASYTGTGRTLVIQNFCRLSVENSVRIIGIRHNIQLLWGQMESQSVVFMRNAAIG